MAEKKNFCLVKAAEPRVISWPCTIKVPIDGGTHEEQTLTALFAVVDQDRIDACLENPLLRAMHAIPDKDKKKEAPAEPEYGTPLLRLVVKGFAEVHMQNITLEEALKLYLSNPICQDALTEGFFDMIGRRLRKN